MISDIKLKLILDLYKNDKLTLEEAKILLQEEPKEEKFTGPFQPYIPTSPWVDPFEIGDTGKPDWTWYPKQTTYNKTATDPGYDFQYCLHCNRRCNNTCNQ